jgi:hypothetical protein
VTGVVFRSLGAHKPCSQYLLVQVTNSFNICCSLLNIYILAPFSFHNGMTIQSEVQVNFTEIVKPEGVYHLVAQ